MEPRPLNSGKPYYTWAFDEETGVLSIESECCGDDFTPDQLVALYDTLDAHFIKLMYK